MNTLYNFQKYYRSDRKSFWINLFSLVPGLCCCLLIANWILSEYNVDKCFPKLEQIVSIQGYHEGREAFGGAPPLAGPSLTQENPEVTAFTRNTFCSMSITCKNENYNFSSQYCDAAYAEIFDIGFTEGRMFQDQEKDKCVVCEKVAQAISPEGSALNSTIQIEDKEYTICGIYKNWDVSTTVGTWYIPDIKVPILSNDKTDLSMWYNNSFETYILTKPGTDITELDKKIRDRPIQSDPDNQLHLRASKLSERYLYAYGNIKNVRIMGMIALFILMIACINFINLATANFARRAFNTGLRKILGASRTSLIIGNMINSLLLVILAMVFAYTLAMMILPFFNTAIGCNLSKESLFSTSLIGISLTIIIFTALLSGIYPAIYISSAKAADILHSKSLNSNGSTQLRKGLVVIQFGIATALIICSFIISRQINMYKEMDLGYNWKQTFYVTARNDNQRMKLPALKQELLKESVIKRASISTSNPSNIGWSSTGFNWEGHPEGINPLIIIILCDEDYSSLFDIKVTEGRFLKDGAKECVINRQFAEIIGKKDIVGKNIWRDDETVQVVGIVDNFRFNNFTQTAEPMIFLNVQVFAMYTLNILTEGLSPLQAKEIVIEKGKQILGEEPKIKFNDENIDRILQKEIQTKKMVIFFSILSIVISSLGLFGLVSFLIERKRKEIAVRRVNGASIGEIISMLNLNFLKPVFLGFIIASPIAYYLMQLWLENYIDKTEFSWWIIPASGAMVVIIASFTLIWKSWNAATDNPVDSLKGD